MLSSPAVIVVVDFAGRHAVAVAELVAVKRIEPSYYYDRRCYKFGRRRLLQHEISRLTPRHKAVVEADVIKVTAHFCLHFTD